MWNLFSVVIYRVGEEWASRFTTVLELGLAAFINDGVVCLAIIGQVRIVRLGAGTFDDEFEIFFGVSFALLFTCISKGDCSVCGIKFGIME